MGNEGIQARYTFIETYYAEQCKINPEFAAKYKTLEAFLRDNSILAKTGASNEPYPGLPADKTASDAFVEQQIARRTKHNDFVASLIAGYQALFGISDQYENNANVLANSLGNKYGISTNNKQDFRAELAEKSGNALSQYDTSVAQAGNARGEAESLLSLALGEAHQVIA